MAGRAVGELAAVLQVPRLLVALPGLLRHRARLSETVLVLPGRGVGDLSTAPLRWVLRRRGHDVRPWGLGVDDGDVDRLLPLVVDLVREQAAAAPRPIVLVGQSMGGYIAREAARRCPDEVALVVTLGTPIFGRRAPGPIRAPIVAIVSPVDRIVPAWRSRDRDPATTTYEVGSPHMGMGVDPDAVRLVIGAIETPIGV
jgi:alpha-beta hydrolase superfamily lysophospholipase